MLLVKAKVNDSTMAKAKVKDSTMAKVKVTLMVKMAVKAISARPKDREATGQAAVKDLRK